MLFDSFILYHPPRNFYTSQDNGPRFIPCLVITMTKREKITINPKAIKLIWGVNKCPNVFGLVSMAPSIVRLKKLFSSTPVGWCLVKRQVLGDVLKRAVFMWSRNIQFLLCQMSSTNPREGRGLKDRLPLPIASYLSNVLLQNRRGVLRMAVAGEVSKAGEWRRGRGWRVGGGWRKIGGSWGGDVNPNHHTHTGYMQVLNVQHF